MAGIEPYDELTSFLRRCRSLLQRYNKERCSANRSAAAALLLRQSFDEARQEALRERVERSIKFPQPIARKEVKKPLVSSGSFGYFSSCWEK